MSASSKKKLRKELNAVAMTEKQKKEQAEARSTKWLTAIFVIIMVAVVITFAATQIISGITRSGVVEKNTIALTVGEHKINSVHMNYYFFDALDQEYTNISNTYGSNASAYFLMQGLDLTKPLNTQTLNTETGETWADHYWDKAVENATSDYTMYALAMADPDFTLSEDMQSTIDNQLLYLSFYASYYGSVDAYLRATYGTGADEASYTEYLTRSVTAYAYYMEKADSLEYDDPAIRAYETDRYDDYTAYNFASYYLGYTSFLPKDVTSADATEDQINAARDEVKNVMLSLGNVTTVEELDAAIKALEVNKDNTDASSDKNESVMHSTLLDDYAEWLSDSERAPGDIKIFPSNTTTTDEAGNETEVTNGYMLIMYQSRNDYLEPMGNVRHLLVKFKGGTTDDEGNTTYSVKEKATAKEEADGYLQEYLNGDKTPESFIELVKAHSEDTSAATGGLFEDIHPNSNYVPNFLSWSIDPNRQAGDVEVIESEYGYHVMYYVGDDELTYRDYMIVNDMKTEDMEKWHTEKVDAVTVTEGDTSRINFDLIYSAS